MLSGPGLVNVQQQSKSTGLFIMPVWTRSLQFVLTPSTLLARSPWKCLINDIMYFMTCSYMPCKWWLAKTQCAIRALEMVQIVCNSNNEHTFNYRHIGDNALWRMLRTYLRRFVLAALWTAPLMLLSLFELCVINTHLYCRTFFSTRLVVELLTSG